MDFRLNEVRSIGARSLVSTVTITPILIVEPTVDMASGRHSTVACLARKDLLVNQRISVIMLGVANLRRARDFYEALGWRLGDTAADGTVIFQADPFIVSLRERAKLAAHSGVRDKGYGTGIMLGYAVESLIDVEMILGEARGAGATITQPASRTLWGGHSGVFVDPDGHSWEVFHNPAWALGEDGAVPLRSPRP